MVRFPPRFPQNTARRRTGCLGCLGCIPQTLLVFALSGVVMLAIVAVFAPWGFYLGGRFHILPYWQGWGTLHAKSGNYVVFVRIEPSNHTSHILPASSLQGSAYLCSPRGERFPMTLGGGMRRGLDLNTDGEKISLYMYYRAPLFGSLSANHRPSIELRGVWHNPSMVMDDQSSIQRAFNSDGTVYQGGGAQRPYLGEVVPVTIVPGSYSDFEAACKSSH